MSQALSGVTIGEWLAAGRRRDTIEFVMALRHPCPPDRATVVPSDRTE